MEPLFVVDKIIGLPGCRAVNNFVREGPATDVVSDWRQIESDYYFHLFSASWKLIQGTSKNLSKFVSGKAMAFSVSSWLHYVTWQKW